MVPQKWQSSEGNRYNPMRTRERVQVQIGDRRSVSTEARVDTYPRLQDSFRSANVRHRGGPALKKAVTPVGNQIAADTALKDRTKIHVLVRQSRGVYIR